MNATGPVLIRYNRLFIAVFLLWLFPGLYIQAQRDVESYRYDIGVSAGMSGYLGDANRSNMFRNPGIAADAFVRYLIDSRWAVRAQLGVATLSGNTSKWSDRPPLGKDYSFKSTLFDISVRGECNFFAFGIGETYRRLSRWSPFMSVGVGVAMASTGGSAFAGLEIPLGVGVRYKPSRRVNLHAEFTMAKVLSDHMDSVELADLAMVKSSFLKNTDWYSSLTIGISYEFGPRCVTCHRID